MKLSQLQFFILCCSALEFSICILARLGTLDFVDVEEVYWAIEGCPRVEEFSSLHVCLILHLESYCTVAFDELAVCDLEWHIGSPCHTLELLLDVVLLKFCDLFVRANLADACDHKVFWLHIREVIWALLFGQSGSLCNGCDSHAHGNSDFDHSVLLEVNFLF